jgi:hypothetical protein
MRSRRRRPRGANPGTACTHRRGAVPGCGGARNMAGRAARPSGAVQALSRAGTASRRTGGNDGPLRDEPRRHGAVGCRGSRLRPRRPGSGGAGVDTARPAIAQATARGRTAPHRIGRPAALRTPLRRAIRTSSCGLRARSLNSCRSVAAWRYLEGLLTT